MTNFSLLTFHKFSFAFTGGDLTKCIFSVPSCANAFDRKKCGDTSMAEMNSIFLMHNLCNHYMNHAFSFF